MSSQTAPPSPGSEQSPGVSRRLVTRTAAWATPVVLSAATAPAYAADQPPGQCTDHGQAVLGRGRLQARDRCSSHPRRGRATVSLQHTDSTGKVLDLDSTSGTIGTTEYTPGWSYLTLHHRPRQGTRATRITLTLTFDAPVKNLALTVTDIDRLPGQWFDSGLHLTGSHGHGPRACRSPAAAPGTTPSPARSPRTSTTTHGDVAVTWPSALTTVQLVLGAADSKNNGTVGQQVGVGPDRVRQLCVTRPLPRAPGPSSRLASAGVLVTRTAAWATPVVLSAATAPAYAATSHPGCTDSGSAVTGRRARSPGHRASSWATSPQVSYADVATSAQNGGRRSPRAKATAPRRRRPTG